MTMIKCDACGKSISKKATACPGCGQPNKKASHLSGGQVILYLLIAGVAIWFFASGGMENKAGNDLQTIKTSVATDAVAQYEIASRQGDKMQICVQAGMVVAAYLQANDEASYKKWKNTQARDCKKAGVPF